LEEKAKRRRHVLKRYKVVCGWCLWRELRKPGVKVRIGAGSLE